jgi:UDP-glucose 4-epimerase
MPSVQVPPAPALLPILVTGGAGYVGSHIVVLLALHGGYQPIILDNHVNSSPRALERIAKIIGTPPIAYRVDMRDAAGVEGVFARHPDIHAVIHCAGLKAVGESAALPLLYYQNNVAGTLVLLEAMQRAGVGRLIFSSSATVYGTPARLPLDEGCPAGTTTNPYGRSKWMVEEVLRDVCAARPLEWGVVVLRYFNPTGAHPSGLIGEDPCGIPNNLMPYVAQVGGEVSLAFITRASVSARG